MRKWTGYGCLLVILAGTMCGPSAAGPSGGVVPPKLTRTEQKHLDSALFASALVGSADQVRLLLRRGADVHEDW